MIDMSQPVHRLSNAELGDEYDDLTELEWRGVITRKQERRLEDVERECFTRGFFSK
jgi:hypothetical protein